MRAAIILAMIPLGIATAFLPRWPDPQPAVAGVRQDSFMARFEAVYPKHTFEERWWPGEGLPLPQASPPVDLLAPKVIRTIRITKDAVGFLRSPPGGRGGTATNTSTAKHWGGRRPNRSRRTTLGRGTGEH